MTGRLLLGSVVLVLTVSSCTQGARQHWADSVRSSVDDALDADALVGTITVEVEARPFRDGSLLQSRVGAATAEALPVRLRPRIGRAAIGDERGASAIFIPGIMFQRRPLLPVEESAPEPQAQLAADRADGAQQVTAVAPERDSLPTNVPALAVVPAADGAGTTVSTAGSSSRPPWLAVSFAILSERDDNRVIGAYGLNPIDVVALARGALTGSIERVETRGAGDDAVVHYRGRLGTDLATGGDDEQAQNLAKALRAHGVSGIVQRFEAWIGADDRLRRLTVELDQELAAGDRSALVITLDHLEPDADPAPILLPTHEEASKLESFGQLVQIVGGDG